MAWTAERDFRRCIEQIIHRFRDCEIKTIILISERFYRSALWHNPVRSLRNELHRNLSACGREHTASAPEFPDTANRHASCRCCPCNPL